MAKKFDKYVKELKKLLQDGTEFSDIDNYFFDHFAENREFMQMGRRKNNPMLVELAIYSARQLMGETAEVHSILFTYVNKYKLYHGIFSVGFRPGHAFYFQDAMCGLMAVVGLDGVHDYIRLSSTMIESTEEYLAFVVIPEERATD